MLCVVLAISFSADCFASRHITSDDIKIISPCVVRFDDIQICGRGNVVLEFSVDPKIINETENSREASLIMCRSKDDVMQLLAEQDGSLSHNVTITHQIEDIKMLYIVRNDTHIYARPMTEKLFSEYLSGRERYYKWFGKK